MRSPNLNALRMFDAAARHLNFRLAADEVNLTQGAVAQQVRRLETDLGFKLFHRKARGLALTEVGRRYHLPVRRALSIIDEATKALRPESARITISAVPSLAAKWLVPRLGAFAETHPDISVETRASEALADFKADGVDIAVRLGNPPFGAGLNFARLAPLELRAVCAPAFMPKLGPNKGIEAFVAHPLIQDSHGHWDRLLEKLGLEATRPMRRFNQTALAMDAAMHGQGIALVPRLLLEPELAEGRLVELWRDARETAEGYYVVYPEIRKPKPARQAVLDWLLSEAAGKPPP